MNNVEKQISLLSYYFKAIRIWAGWSRNDVAKMFGCTQAQICNFENDIPASFTINKIQVLMMKHYINAKKRRQFK